MNRVVLMGRLTRDPEIRWMQGQDQKCMARFTLAVDRRVAKRDEDTQTADFIACMAFGKTAEFAEKYLLKGTKIAIEGRIRTGSYTNRAGQKVYTTDVVVDSCEFAESGGSGGQRGGQGSGYRDGDGRYHDGHGSVDNTKDGFMDIPEGVDDEGLPFN